MNSRLILVEGIPGAGKTTTARKEKLIDEGKEAIFYEEGMSHPADMAWNACLKEDEYNDFIKKCSEMWEGSKKSISKEELISRIQRQTRIEDNNVILAYTKIDFPEDCYWSLIGDVASKEICDGRKSLDEFRDIHLRRWSKFAEQALLNDNIYIFECAFLQNHIFELLGVYEKSDEEIYLYLKSLLETVKSLSPSIVYIEPSSVEDIIIQAANESKSPEGSRPDWIDEVANWVSNMNFGKSHNLKGIEGVFYFCKERLRIDKLMIEKLNVSVTIIKR